MLLLLVCCPVFAVDRVPQTRTQTARHAIRRWPSALVRSWRAGDTAWVMCRSVRSNLPVYRSLSLLGHYAYIKLVLPVYHIGYFKQVITMLQDICKVRMHARAASPLGAWLVSSQRSVALAESLSRFPSSSCLHPLSLLPRPAPTSFSTRMTAGPTFAGSVARTSRTSSGKRRPRPSTPPVARSFIVLTAVRRMAPSRRSAR